MHLPLLILQESPQQGSTMLPFVLMLLAIFAVFYFFIIRPQKKRETDRKAMIAAVKKNDRIVTAGGIHGTILKVDDTSVLVEVDSTAKFRIEKTALSSVVTK